MQNKINISQLTSIDETPMELLLLADPSVEAIKDYLKRGICYVAKEDEQVVGVYVLLKTRPFTIELVNIAVADAKQGQGIGKQLVFDCINRARALGVKILEVGTGNSSIGQLAFYQKCGFRIKSVDFDFFTIHHNEKIMENGIWCRDMIRLELQL
ncbi:MAG TPA: GNAT family N-acetyltransferase [Bacillota bacterium]|jgi:N-acetylglutamate synthase-like GNAT family acetyltransferase|nr:GNAT family N-acetyltransferase [Bacillota bacterium]HOL11082.1 GNAT family N-acetyltransferase [Bacillota bacterium]HPO97723.1 GNAT family N-acetyltransferase [Bacillota bacterium]